MNQNHRRNARGREGFKAERNKPRLRRARLVRFELLEDRRMLAPVTVDTNLDVLDGDTRSIADLIASPGPDGKISLREATSVANNTSGPDTISFAPSVFETPLSISLSLGQLTISEELTIDGPSVGLTIDAQLASRVFEVGIVGDSFPLTLRNLKLTGGKTTGLSEGGGAIRMRSEGLLTLIRSTVSDNSTSGGEGGGIYSRGNVTLTDSTVSGNSTSSDGALGGGILSFADVTLANSTVSGNSTAGQGANGGGILARGDITLTHSTVSGSSANNGAGGGLFSDGEFTLANSIVAANTAGRSGPVQPLSLSPLIEWSWDSSMSEPDYVQVKSAPSIIDLNGDTVPDVVFGSANTNNPQDAAGFLRALNGSNGAELFTVADISLQINASASVATGTSTMTASRKLSLSTPPGCNW